MRHTKKIPENPAELQEVIGLIQENCANLIQKRKGFSVHGQVHSIIIPTL